MQIDSGLNNYGYSARPYPAERKPDEKAPQAPEVRIRSLTGLTGSSTLLSTNLASALWAVEGAKEDAEETSSPLSPTQITDVYSEF